MSTTSLRAPIVCLLLACAIGAGAAHGQAAGTERYNNLEDAAIAMAKRWQSGQKARPLMSADGKILFPFGQSMPQLTCSPSRACDVEMEPGEKIKSVALADKVNWTWVGAESVEQGKPVQHVVVQPNDKELETNVIVFTDRRSYHIKLYSPKTEGAYLNRIGFYYPDALVTSWESKAQQTAETAEKEAAQRITPVPINPENLALDYRVDGTADFRPLHVFNNGEQTFIVLPGTVRANEYPLLQVLDEKGKSMVIAYRSRVSSSGDVVYTVDRLFERAELLRGSEKVSISWKRKEKGFWSAMRGDN